MNEPVHDDDLDELVHRADLDGLVRLVDARCAGRDWEGLRRVRDRSRRAVETGRQLWPAATLAEYRLALLAPAELAARVVVEGAGRFALGPLSEVVAQHHTWAELSSHLEPGPGALYVAHERAIRGEAIDVASVTHLPAALDIPPVVQPWEPPYALAVYHDDHAEFPAPDLPPTGHLLATVEGAERLDDDVELALRQLIEPWTAASQGHAESVCVAGGAAEALGALGVGEARVAPLEPATAVSWLGWAGASGGAHARRRGAAVGRFGAWWVIAALGDVLDSWPVHPDVLGAVAADLRWSWFETDEARTGWRLQLVVEDVEESVAWAVVARDDA